MSGNKLISPCLWKLDKRKVTVPLRTQGREIFFRGHATYEQDSELGPVLRIRLPHDEETELLLAERDWSGEIRPAMTSDCDFVLESH